MVPFFFLGGGGGGVLNYKAEGGKKMEEKNEEQIQCGTLSAVDQLVLVLARGAVVANPVQDALQMRL